LEAIPSKLHADSGKASISAREFALSRNTIDSHLQLPIAVTSAMFAEYLRFFGRRMYANAEFAQKSAAFRSPAELAEATALYWQAAVYDFQNYLGETYSRIGSLAVATADVVDHATDQKKKRKTAGKKRLAARGSSSSKQMKTNAKI
jgi:hypothetical protein